jgi:hypothetical protein
MPDIEAKTIELERNSCLFRQLDAVPFPSLVLMTSSSDLP